MHIDPPRFSTRLFQYCLFTFLLLFFLTYAGMYFSIRSSETSVIDTLLSDLATRMSSEIETLIKTDSDNWRKDFTSVTDSLPYRISVHDEEGKILSHNSTPSLLPDPLFPEFNRHPQLLVEVSDQGRVYQKVQPLPEGNPLRGSLLLQARLSSSQSPSLLLVVLISFPLTALLLYPVYKSGRKISSVFDNLTAAMERMLKEETLVRPKSESDLFLEVRQMLKAFQKLSVSVADRVRAIMRQRNELDAVLEGMTEAVLAIDTDERLINANRSAEKLLSFSIAEARQKSITDVVQDHEFLAFVRRSLRSGNAVQNDISLIQNDEQFFQGQASPLLDSDGTSTGVVIVLNDVTSLKRLQRVRQDFVANVSHELRTPITSIEGFLETLQDGALDNPDDAKRFVDIALRQARRLSAIINDLLELSRIEQNAGQFRETFVESNVSDCVESAVQVVESRAHEKNIEIKSRCSEDLVVVMNPSLIEQALINLLDNAIKYSDYGTTVTIEVTAIENQVEFSVTDSGSGIEAHHHPRLFERFYRIDRARSRNAGGTGLGLSIVRHIAQVHGGSPAIQSEIGKGSKFSFSIPGRQ